MSNLTYFYDSGIADTLELIETTKLDVQRAFQDNRNSMLEPQLQRMVVGLTVGKDLSASLDVEDARLSVAHLKDLSNAFNDIAEQNDYPLLWGGNKPVDLQICAKRMEEAATRLSECTYFSDRLPCPDYRKLH